MINQHIVESTQLLCEGYWCDGEADRLKRRMVACKEGTKMERLAPELRHREVQH